jgi:hypothetical protein
MMYSKLDIFRHAIHEIQECVWWLVARANPRMLHQCKLAVRMLVGEHGLNCNTGRFRGIGKNCTLCELHLTETLEHFLFVCNCEEMTRSRAELWGRVENNMPPEMVDHVRTMTHKDKTVFILAGCNSWVPEWMNMYIEILRFLKGLYYARGKLIDEQMAN